jgi:predicted nucleic acid-binding protein
MAFLDTNVLVYANDSRDPEKQKVAADIVAQHMRSGMGAISFQVMQEYAQTALSKLGQREDVVLRVLRLFEALTVVPGAPALVRRAVELRRVYGISFWDAGIVAAAEEADCDTLFTEDFNEGQFYGGIRVVNPFARVKK